VEVLVFNEALAKFDPYKGGAFRSTEESDKGGRILQTQKIASARMS